jgi:hypothetical protein
MNVANRANNKDVYDLDYLTDEIPLKELMYLLGERESKYYLAEQQKTSLIRMRNGVQQNIQSSC